MHKRAVIEFLLNYIVDRHASPLEHLTTFFFIPFGCSKPEKLAAAEAILKVLLGVADLSSLTPHYKALNQGRLGKWFNSSEVQHYLVKDVAEFDYVLPNF